MPGLFYHLIGKLDLHNKKKFLKFFSYLAVVAGLCAEADYIFIPEDPPKVDWQTKLCQQLQQARQQKKKLKQNYAL